MIKKSKTCHLEIADKIKDALEFNKEHIDNPIRLVSIEITRGVYNMGDKLVELVSQEVNDPLVEYRLKDNEDRGIFFCATLTNGLTLFNI